MHWRFNVSIGVVKWFDPGKGFGFIESSDCGSDVFAHFSQIEMEGYRTLRDGQQVEFELSDGPKGASAIDIRPVAAAAPEDALVSN